MGIKQDDAHDRGVRDGWDAANYAQAYGTRETVQQEAERRTVEKYGDVASTVGDAYRDGFIKGWDFFVRDYWPDGTPRADS